MPRGLDHVVHAVRDLDAAAELYRRMGFTVGARNRHSWGTHNRIVQLPGFFIELLTVAEPEKLGSDGFSKLFGAFNRDFLNENEGLSLLILESADAAADERAFRAAGIANSETLHFEREGKRPDGSAVKVAFTLAFARDAAAPGTSFAVCRQHYPENFWNPALQQHANWVTGVSGVVLAAARPNAHREFLAAFAGQPDVRENAGGIAVATPRGEIAVMGQIAFRGAFGIAPASSAHGARLAALRFVVGDIASTLNVLQSGNVAAVAHGNQIVVGAGTAMGATIVFEKAGTVGR